MSKVQYDKLNWRSGDTGQVGLYMQGQEKHMNTKKNTLFRGSFLILITAEWDKNTVNVLIELSVHIRSSYFLKCTSVQDQEETRLARVGVDDRYQDHSYKQSFSLTSKLEQHNDPGLKLCSRLTVILWLSARPRDEHRLRRTAVLLVPESHAFSFCVKLCNLKQHNRINSTYRSSCRELQIWKEKDFMCAIL